MSRGYFCSQVNAQKNRWLAWTCPVFSANAEFCTDGLAPGPHHLSSSSAKTAWFLRSRTCGLSLLLSVLASHCVWAHPNQAFFAACPHYLSRSHFFFNPVISISLNLAAAFNPQIHISWTEETKLEESYITVLLRDQKRKFGMAQWFRVPAVSSKGLEFELKYPMTVRMSCKHSRSVSVCRATCVYTHTTHVNK